MSKPSIYAVATMDTKGEELSYLVECMRRVGVHVVTVDVGTDLPPVITPDVTREQVLGRSASDLGKDRGLAVTRMGEALCKYLVKEEQDGLIAGVIGIGGSGGTALITAAMRALPIGLPKLMVSTVASGNTAPYVDCSDITMMYSVVDVAGLNAVSMAILRNAANAMAGMAMHTMRDLQSRPAIGMTMFGVTTPCVTAVRQALEKLGFDCLVFHATGAGGRAMERLVESGLLVGVLDITTTEVADEIAGGVFPSGPHRFERLMATGIPLVLSLGALDMVNFGSKETVPNQYRERPLHIHNAQVTLMRTNAEENRKVARWLAGKWNQATSPWTLLIPEKGVSMLDAEGMPFHDPNVDQVLFDELQSSLILKEGRRLIRQPLHINDSAFAASLVEEFMKLVRTSSRPDLVELCKRYPGSGSSE